MAANFVTLKLTCCRKRIFPKIERLYPGKVEQIEADATVKFLTAVLTSWLAPCTGWSVWSFSKILNGLKPNPIKLKWLIQAIKTKRTMNFFFKGAQFGGRTWDLFDFRLFYITSSTLDHLATALPINLGIVFPNNGSCLAAAIFLFQFGTANSSPTHGSFSYQHRQLFFVTPLVN